MGRMGVCAGTAALVLAMAGCAAVLGIEDIPRPARGDASAATGDAGDAGEDAPDAPPTFDAGPPSLRAPHLTVTGVDGAGSINATLHLGKSWYVGGKFTRISPFSASNLIALDPTGTPTACPLSTPAVGGLNGPVYAIAQTATAIYVGGQFVNYQGETATFLAKMDPVTCAIDKKFTAPSAFDGHVRALAVHSTGLFVGGQFTKYRGVAGAANYIAKLDLATGELDTKFNPPATNGFNDKVDALVVAGGSVYVAGHFDRYRGGFTNRIAKIDLMTGVLDTTFHPVASTGFNGPSYALAANATHLFVGGAFTTYRDAPANHIAKLDLGTGALDATFSPATGNGFDGNVHALALDGTHVYAGGAFTAYRGTASAARIAKLGLGNGNIDTTFSPAGATPNGFDGAVDAIALTATDVYAGGSFTGYRGVPDSAHRLAKLDLKTGALDSSFKPAGSTANGVGGFMGGAGANSVFVTALVWSGKTLWLGGSFTAYGGSPVTNVAKLDDTTFQVDTTFSPPDKNGFDDGASGVRALAGAGSTLYVGGSFTTYRGVPGSASRIAKLDANTGALDTTFSPPGALANGFDGIVTCLAPEGNRLFVGGFFNAYRNVPSSARLLAKLDATTGAIDTTFGPAGASANGFEWGGAIASVYGLAATGSDVYVGGYFTAYRGAPLSANHIAKLDANTGVLDTTFSPSGATANGFDTGVNALAIDATHLFVGGEFTAYRGVASSANRIAKLDLKTGTLDTTFTPEGALTNGFDGPVAGLAVSGSSVYAVGSFTAYKGTAGSANRIAKLDRKAGALDTMFNPLSSPSPNGFTGYQTSVSTIAVGKASCAGCGPVVMVGGYRLNTYRGSLVGNLAALDPASGVLR